MSFTSPVKAIPLRPGLPLTHEEGACLPLRSRHGQCSACAQACPAGALQVSLAGIALSDACTGCGRCTAACPTQALSLPELAQIEVLIQSTAAPAPLRIECRKAQTQTAHAPGTTLTLPCLGSVTPGHLMALHAAGHDVQLVNRGWCAQCEAGGGTTHPAQAALETAVLWLSTVARDNARLPRLLDDIRPPQAMPLTIPPAPAIADPVSRRTFFRDAMQRPAGRQHSPATPMGSHGRALYPADQRQPSPERQRQLQALQTLATRNGLALPQEFFPVLAVDASCCDQRLCVAVCPTAALSTTGDGGSVALALDAARCIACGACQRSCPQGAMTLHPHGGVAGVQILIRHAQQTCLSCANTYTPQSADAGLCPTCEKSRRFMNDARRQLFGAGARNDSAAPPS